LLLLSLLSGSLTAFRQERFDMWVFFGEFWWCRLERWQ
jgi:hypothetical protein